MYNLNLDCWQTIRTTESRTRLKVYACYAGPIECQACGSRWFYESPLPAEHDEDNRRFIDLPFMHAPVKIFVGNDRAICPDCKQRLVPRLPGIDAHHQMTERCREEIEDELFVLPNSTIAGMFDLSAETIRRIGDRLIERVMNGRHYVAPLALGIDEVSIDGHLRTVFVHLPMQDGEKAKIIDILEDTKMETVSEALIKLSHYEGIQYVTMDLRQGYRSIVRKMLPRAHIVLDRWHVERLVAEARRNPDFKQSLVTWRAIWDIKGMAAAEDAWDLWESQLTPLEQQAFRSVIKLRRDWPKELFAYWQYGGLTNAATERMNGLIKNITNVHRGSSFRVVRAKALYRNTRPNIEFLRCPKCGNYFADRLEDGSEDNCMTLVGGEYERQPMPNRNSKAYNSFPPELKRKLEARRKQFSDVLPIRLDFMCRECASESNQLGPDMSF